MVKNPFLLQEDEIRKKAAKIRANALRMNTHAGQGHTGADLSEADILATLYFRVLRTSPEHQDNSNRDRFILSKGHGVGGYYCTLAEAGFFPESELETYLQFDSRLPGHPVRQKTPGIEMNTGGLGHGLPVAVGLALAAKRQDKPYRTYVLTGDGELQEGSNWEAAMSAARFGLDNLVWIIDRNTLQLADRTETIMPIDPLDKKLAAFNMEVIDCEGNNPADLIKTLEGIDFSNGKPHAVIAHTKKGCGVSFIEDNAAWHHKIPTEEELPTAIEELMA